MEIKGFLALLSPISFNICLLYSFFRIRKWSNLSYTLSTIAGNGVNGSSVGYNSQFNGSYGVCCDTNGIIYK
jgi:hypothetical protein